MALSVEDLEKTRTVEEVASFIDSLKLEANELETEYNGRTFDDGDHGSGRDRRLRGSTRLAGDRIEECGERVTDRPQRRFEGLGERAATVPFPDGLADGGELDETFRLQEDGLCVLAPHQTTVGGVQMAERLLGQLDDLEAAGGLPIGISAGVVACPEHGTDAEELLRRADEGMWRARAVGQPVGVGALQDQ